MYVATVSADHPDHLTGWVASMEDGLRTAIVCHHIDNEWVPQYALKRDNPHTDSYERLELPSCFEIDPRAVNALDSAYTEETSK